MDLMSLYYFTEAAKDLHITRTANRLYISQQTLSNHILRLEEQFGTPLLTRKPKLALTYAGELVLAFAEKVLQERRNLDDILADIGQNERGVLRFGASVVRMNLLAFVFPTFTARYPNVELRLTSATSRQLEPLVSGGELDLALVSTDCSDAALVREELMQDQLYLCVPDPLLQEYCGAAAEEIKVRSLPGAKIGDFAALPTAILTNQMGLQIQHCYEEAGVTPKVRLTTEHIRICTTLGFQGSVAFFSTRSNLMSRQEEIPDNLNIFPLLYQEEPMYLKVSMLRHSQRYLSGYARYFLELVSACCAAAERTPVSRIAAKT